MASSYVNIEQLRASLTEFGFSPSNIALQIEQAREQAQIQEAVLSTEQNRARKQEEIDIVRGLLISNDLVLIDTEGDGNCFYYALQGYGLIKNIPALSVDNSVMRQKLAGFIRGIRNNAHKSGSQPESFANNIISQILSQETTAYLKREYNDPRDLIDAYCTEIQKDKQWASDTDITILAKNLNKCITTRIVSNGTLGKPQPHMDKSGTCLDPIQVSWTSGNHYSLLISENDPDYIALRDFAFKERIPLKLPLVPRLTEFLRKYHLKKGTKVESSSTKPAQAASSSSSKPSVSGSWECPRCTFNNQSNARICEMCGYTRQTSSNVNPLSGYATNAANSLRQLSLNESIHRAQSAAPNNGRAAQAAASSSFNAPDEEYIAILREQIRIYKQHIKDQSELKQPDETYLKMAKVALQKRINIATKLGLSLGGTRKRKIQKRKTQRRKTRQNKNKSRRRL